jgi:hypothetical protein
MLDKKEIFSAIRISRIIFYIVTLVVYLYGRFFYYSDTLCNHGYRCPFCGLRTAMYYIEHGNFIKAYESNKLCLLVVILFLIALIDSIRICISYIIGKMRAN